MVFYSQAELCAALSVQTRRAGVWALTHYSKSLTFVHAWEEKNMFLLLHLFLPLITLSAAVSLLSLFFPYYFLSCAVRNNFCSSGLSLYWVMCKQGGSYMSVSADESGLSWNIG